MVLRLIFQGGAVEQRIEKLERQCRWYRNLFILAGLIAVALVTWGAAKPLPKVIRANQFEVWNDHGKQFGRWDLTGFHALDGFGTTEAALVSASGGQLQLWNADQTRLLIITDVGFLQPR